MPSKEEAELWKKQLVENAEKKIIELTDSDQFKNYLTTLSKFHSYSINNINLIYSQNPDATHVAGFKQWGTDFNRKVNKGEKAIRIAAPIIKKLSEEEKIKPKTTDERAIVGYRYIPVFDVSQTSGDPLPSARDFVKENLSEVENVDVLYKSLKNYINQNTDIKVSEEVLSDFEVKGFFRPSTNQIIMNESVDNITFKLKTLYHEFAHSQLHGLNSEFIDRPTGYKETQAEAVAYIAMQNVGIDTSEYSLGYVATWAKDKNVIQEALSEIHKVSNKTIDMTNHLIQELGLDQNLATKYKSLQKEATKNNSPELNKKIKDTREKISQNTQKELNDFAKENPTLKQPKIDNDEQELSR
ncbi:ArdC-like ssDNA-binding domain-containing protein [Lactococcus lactis]|uniref:ArdC-like ssDNA-binding domain-containing protein n=1 Tax=Lactococcus lactis TaxID=1358 RepID=UPI00223BA990|nr:ArdC-like ssDNA-binding domain-containing protein [Lactococcus lactis]MCT0441951.1 hypothetical protein [Lactococcus lactis subsp. lactis]